MGDRTDEERRSKTRNKRKRPRLMPDHNMTAYAGRLLVAMFAITALALSMSSTRGCDFLTVETISSSSPWTTEPFKDALEVRIGVFQYEVLNDATTRTTPTTGCIDYEMNRKEMRAYYPKVSRAQRCAYSGPIFGIIGIGALLLDTLVFLSDYGAFVASLCFLLCFSLQGGTFGLMRDLCINDDQTECIREQGVVIASFACVLYAFALGLFCSLPKPTSGAPPLAISARAYDRQQHMSLSGDRPPPRRNAGAMWAKAKKQRRRIKERVKKRRHRKKGDPREEAPSSQPQNQPQGKTQPSTPKDAPSNATPIIANTTSSKPSSARRNGRSRSRSRPPRTGRSTSRSRNDRSKSRTRGNNGKPSSRKGRSRSRSKDIARSEPSRDSRSSSKIRRNNSEPRGRSASPSRSLKQRQPPGRSKSGMSSASSSKKRRAPPGRTASHASNKSMPASRKPPRREPSGQKANFNRR